MSNFPKQVIYLDVQLERHMFRSADLEQKTLVSGLRVLATSKSM